MSPIALEVDSIVDFRLVIDLKRQIRHLTFEFTCVRRLPKPTVARQEEGRVRRHFAA